MKIALDFTPKSGTKVHLDFRPTVYLRDRTHTYLWLRDGYKFGYFLTMDTGMVTVAKVDIIEEILEPEVKADKKRGIAARPAKIAESYRIWMDRETSFDLVPYKYDFVKAVRLYHESTLRRTPEAEREMRQVLGMPLDTNLDDLRITGQGEVEVKPRERKPREQREPKEAAGYTLQELCAELKLDPTEARKALRAAKVEKPGARWEWATKEAATAVRAVLEAA